jgi:predicted lipoprotein with Yx(FWY)xxD motif
MHSYTQYICVYIHKFIFICVGSGSADPIKIGKIGPGSGKIAVYDAESAKGELFSKIKGMSLFSYVCTCISIHKCVNACIQI